MDKLFYQIGCDDVKVCVDSREQDKIPLFKEYVESGKCKFINEVKVGTYPVSDVSDDFGIVGIERKKTDFVSDTFSGKLDQQLKELKDNFQYPFLFIEYDGVCELITANLGINPDVIIGKLASILARHHITIMFVDGMYVPFACRMIEKFYDFSNPVKQYSPIRMGRKPVKRNATAHEVKLDIISRIPRIGIKKGRKLLEKFDFSINKITNANVCELVEIDGIGQTLAKQIKEVFE